MLRFKCHYCKAVFKDFTSLWQHFEAMHRNGEYIEIPVEDITDGPSIQHTS